MTTRPLALLLLALSAVPLASAINPDRAGADVRAEKAERRSASTADRTRMRQNTIQTDNTGTATSTPAPSSARQQLEKAKADALRQGKLKTAQEIQSKLDKLR